MRSIGKVDVPRIRMIAGPNGSGKSTLLSLIPSEVIGRYVNADRIEQELRTGGLDLAQFALALTEDVVRDYLRASPFLAATGMAEAAEAVSIRDQSLTCHEPLVNSYVASVLADFIRRELLRNRQSFTFETVMSSPDKVAFLAEARSQGYRCYLYFVATDNPRINIERIAHRVREGGHPVPTDKVISRYHRSLGLLPEAVKQCHRAYLFDNSGAEIAWFAELTDGAQFEIKTPDQPHWFSQAFKLPPAEA